jgi:hypothetical protein
MAQLNELKTKFESETKALLTKEADLLAKKRSLASKKMEFDRERSLLILDQEMLVK